MIPRSSIAIVGALGWLAVPAASQPSFTLLGVLPGGFSHASNAFAVSADNTTVVGMTTSANAAITEAFRWRESTGMVGLGVIPLSTGSSNARAVSTNGSVVVGGTGHKDPQIGQAFRWTPAIGLVPIGHLPAPGPVIFCSAYGVSADGSVVCGYSFAFGGIHAFRWTEQQGMVSLGDLPGGSELSRAEAMSADGTVIVGGGTSFSGYEAFRWTEATGMVGLGDLPGGIFESWANGVSAGGQIIVGGGTGASGQRAVRWTAATGMISLGTLPGHNYSWAYGVSADGRRIVGVSPNTFQNQEAFLWDPVHGMRSLRQVLEQVYGVPVIGVDRLNTAAGISADGTAICGTAFLPGGRSEAYLARIPPFCYPNCDGSTTPPVVNIADFSCFIRKYAAGDVLYADCNLDFALSVSDFSCFLQEFAAGCP